MLYKEKLTVIAHLPHYLEDDKIFAYEPYVREMELWSKHFSKVEIYTDLKSIKPAFAIKELPGNCIAKPIFVRSGSGLVNNMVRLFQIPFAMLQILFVMMKADFLHLRSPGITTWIANSINIFLNKKTIVKWATNFPPDRALGKISSWESKVLLRSKSRTKVLVYRNYNKSNFIPFFPALFTSTELENFQKGIDPHKWQSNGKKKIICIGRFHQDKNIELIIEAVSLYKKVNNEIGFIIELIGDGPLKEHIILSIKNLDLQDNIILRGSLKFQDVIKSLQSSHFLVMPGKNEGWSKVINEALATNCIPLVINAGNSVRVMELMGLSQLLFDPTPIGLVNKIRESLNLPFESIREILQIGKDENNGRTLESFSNKIGSVVDSLNHDYSKEKNIDVI